MIYLSILEALKKVGIIKSSQDSPKSYSDQGGIRLHWHTSCISNNRANANGTLCAIAKTMPSDAGVGSPTCRNIDSAEHGRDH